MVAVYTLDRNFASWTWGSGLGDWFSKVLFSKSKLWRCKDRLCSCKINAASPASPAAEYKISAVKVKNNQQ